jgi:serine/threonine protein kinase
MPATSELLQKGRYRFDSSTPESGNHAVQAYDTTSETKVYVKEIAVRLGKVTTLSQQENMRQNFENAARRLTGFSHASLLKVKDFYSEVGRQFLVLEDLDGDDFQTLMGKNKRPFAVEDVLDWAEQLLDAVNYLHNQSPRVLHKNISPRNVKLSPEGKVKLLGVAVADDSGNLLSTSLGEPEEGVLNFSPLELIWEGLDTASQKVIVNSYDERSEKVLKEAPDVRSDIYSLGATLYLLLTAKTPVDPLERSIELLEGNADPLKAPNVVDTRIAPEISDVLMRALEIKRENRYDSATIMRQVLRTAVVRVKEREAAEAQELEEAAEFLRGTQKLQMPAPTPEPKVSEQSEAEILTQKLREAEELRVEAERRAAEAERLLSEREAERRAAEAERLLSEREAEQARVAAEQDANGPASVAGPEPVDQSGDLLDLISETVASAHASDPLAVSITVESYEEVHSSVKPEPKAKIDLRTIAKQQVKPNIELGLPANSEEFVPAAEQQRTEPSPEIKDISEPFLREEEKQQPSARMPDSVTKFEEDDAVPEFATSKSGLPIPMVAIAGILILIAAVVGYVLLGGSSNGPNLEPSSVPTQNNAAAVEEPQPSAPGPAAETTVNERPENTFTPEAVDTQTGTEDTPEADLTPKAAQKPKAAKPATQPAKTPAPKKAVTADDLINDN